MIGVAYGILHPLLSEEPFGNIKLVGNYRQDQHHLFYLNVFLSIKKLSP